MRRAGMRLVCTIKPFYVEIVIYEIKIGSTTDIVRVTRHHFET